MRISLLLAAASLAGALMPSPAQAGGLFLTDRGTRPLGRGFAFVAGADDPQAIWYNPAGLSWSDQQLLFDATVTFLRASYERVDSGGNTLPSVDANAVPLPIPMLAYSHPIGDWTLGFGVFAPNASLLKWPRGVRTSGGTCDFTGDDASDPDCEPAPQRYSLLSLEGSAFVNLSPAVAYQPIDGLSFGLGMHLMVGSFVGETVISACDGFVCSQPENPEWDSVARFKLTPIIHPGLSAGITYDAGPIRVGVSMVWWPSAVSGDAELDVRLPSAPLFDGARVEGDKARLELDIPFMLRGGVEVRPTRNLRIEAAFVWEHWSTQKAARIEPRNIWIRDAVAIGDYQVGPIRIPRNMNDVYSIRLGGTFRTLGNRLEISAGVNYENSSFDDAYLSPLTLDSSKWITALGVSIQATDGLWIDISYAHVFLQDRNVDNSQVPQPNPIRPPRNPDQPPNEGGTAFVGNGRYNMEADMFGIGLRWQIGREVIEDNTIGVVIREEDEETQPDPTESAPPPVAPSDSDDDGVVDSVDRCAGTPSMEVDSAGCPTFVGDAMTFSSVEFDEGSVAEGPQPDLDRMAHLLEHNPDLRVEIGVHTDSRGSSRFNRRLSQQRARAIQGWLMARGIPEARLEARGYGEESPIAPNSTAEGREQNRRVELRIVE
ncbi:MAG: outer membrane protein transport protein [Myxococcota bacterium]